jgi:hypothetical protein
MASITITVDVPANVSPDVLRAHGEALAEELARKSSEEDERRRVLECDEALAKWIKEKGIKRAVVRARTYDSDGSQQHNLYYQEFWGFRSDDPRRPVIMRGSLWRLVRIHSNSYSASHNGWCDMVMSRWIRAKKITAFSGDEFREQTDDAAYTLSKRHGCTHHFHDGRWGWKHWDDSIFMDGKRIRGLTSGQVAYIKKLDAIRKKTMLIDARRELLMSAQRDRLRGD